MRTPLQSAVIFGFVIFSLSFVNRSASGQWPGYGCWGWNGYYSTYSQESIPYYALNPPVYYSYPVSRTYGLYPFPYIPESSANSFANCVEPKLVINKYVESPAKSVSVSLGEPRPLRIINRFVVQAGESNSVKKASWDKSKSLEPKVVYPTDVAAAK
jgi:hypothetical protein